MPSVELYKEVRDLYALNYVQDRNLETIVVCPSPALADEFRAKLSNDESKVQVITISKFMAEELEEVTKATGQEIQISRKADLMLSLGVIWKKYLTELPTETFFQAFTLFTELRSFTLDLNLVKEVLPQFDSKVAEALERFWLYVDVANLCDEHKAYWELGRNYQEGFTTTVKNLIFSGFSHINANQVDMIKSLASSHNVYIPFPEIVFRDTSPSDWVRWLRPEELDSENEESVEKKICNVVSFPKNRLAETVSSYFKSQDKIDELDIFLGVKNPDFNQLNEIPLGDSYFKAKTDLFSSKLDEVFEFVKSKFSYRDEKIAASDLIESLNEYMQNSLSTSFSKKDFRLITLINLVRKHLKEMSELSEENEFLTLFDIRICEQVAALYLPRTFASPLKNSENIYQVKGVESIESYIEGRPTVLTVTSEYRSIKGADTKYSEEVRIFLSSLGPIQRKDLEFQLIKLRIKEMISNSQTIMFLEAGLTEHDLGWSNILEDFDFNEIELEFVEREEVQDHLLPYINNEVNSLGRVSASRLQTYIDCPRKYYFQYVDKIEVRPQTTCNLRADQLGILEHAVIEKYLTETNDWDDHVHFELVKGEFDNFLDNHKITLAEFAYDRYLLEIRDYSRNGILELLKLKALDSNCEYIFEFDLGKSNETVSGRIDCIVKTDFGIGVIDFKRSKSSIPSAKEISNYEKIQVWYYLANYDLGPDQFAFWGFLNLADVKESRMYTADKELSSTLNGIDFLNNCRFLTNKDPIEDCLSEFEELMAQVKTSIVNDKEFKPIPRKVDVCTFCTVTNICPRKPLGVEK